MTHIICYNFPGRFLLKKKGEMMKKAKQTNSVTDFDVFCN